jgi:4,5-DOPA dioxygenase extradiol
MNTRMPVVFISHGAPDALLNAPDAVACWREIGQRIPLPSAILVISAHWQARRPTASLSGAPLTVHDFSGFDPALQRIHYPAPGAPALAERTVALLSAAGIAADLHPDRGLDHGAWVPLMAMFPQAKVPVTQLSLVQHADAASHFSLGQALAPLRDAGVLILASGAITHNFGWMTRDDQPPLPQALQFNDWVAQRLATHDVAGLLDYRSGSLGHQAHPTEEHFLPLFVALGAAQDDPITRYKPGFTYGNFSMDTYVWGGSKPSDKH